MPTIQLPELGTTYTAIVKKTGGLIKEDTACVNALKKVAEGATEANLKAADTALEAQSKKVKVGMATGGEKAVKAVKQFETDIDKLQADIKKVTPAVKTIVTALS